MIDYIVLFSALLMATISGYVSIIGLTSIFSSPSVFYVIFALGIALEIAKISAISWLHQYWMIAKTVIKTFLISTIIMMMFLNMISAFGFLSKAHIDQAVNLNTGTADQIKIISSKIDYEKETVSDIDKQIKQIDDAINKFTERGQARSSLTAAEEQRKNRNNLLKSKEEHVKNISMLTADKIKLESEYKRAEAEVGPIKYIADLIYDQADTNQLEKAVRFIIIIIVFVFDPLAVILLIAANVGILHRKSLTNQLAHSKIEKNKVLEIKDEVLHNIRDSGEF